MLNDFFDRIKVPEFLKAEFAKIDWYLVISKLHDILDNNIKNTELNSISDSLKYSGKVYIGKNCKIGDYVVIEGPAYIGDNVEIGPHVEIRPGSVISNNCIVAHAAETKNCIMMEQSRISNHSFLGDSIIGYNSRLGGHSETTNRRFDQNEIYFSYKDRKLKTNLDKLGLILGEESRLGGNVVTAPGTMIGKKTFVSTGINVSGFIPPNKFLKAKIEYEIKDNLFQEYLKKSPSIFT
mgnify:CR=1 FL=1